MGPNLEKKQFRLNLSILLENFNLYPNNLARLFYYPTKVVLIFEVVLDNLQNRPSKQG